jgi:cell division protein FtsQ
LVAKNLIVSSDHFRIERVKVKGNSVLSSDSLLKIAQIPLKVPIFNISTESIENKLLKNPWIEEARVERDLPSTVNIIIRERVPVAVLNVAPQSLITANGIVLNIPSNNSYTYLPTLTPVNSFQVKQGETIKDNSTLSLLKQLLTAAKVSEELKQNLNAFYYQDNDIHASLTSPLSEINLGKGVNELAWSTLQARIALQKKNKIASTTEFIDLRIPGKIIVKPANTRNEEYIQG